MKTYTVAYQPDGVLLAIVPDGVDVYAAVEDEISAADIELSRDDYEVEEGLILTDEAPGDFQRIVWRGHHLGYITDENGTPFGYIVRPEST